MSSQVKLTWKGGEIEKRVKRAYARGTIGIAERVSAQGKRNVHKITTQLARSIHTAKVASGGNISPNQRNVLDALGAVCEVGSWIEYACVEEVSRGHRYMQPAIEQIRGSAYITMRQAFIEEGFTK